MPFRSAASLVREALEAAGVSHAFGVHAAKHREVQDELKASAGVKPVLVGHEASAAFMANGVSRTGESVGTVLIESSAGVTSAMGAIAQAFLDGVALLVISVRHPPDEAQEPPRIDQHALLRPVTKGCWRVQYHGDVIACLLNAVRLASSERPGPVYVDLDLSACQGPAGSRLLGADIIQPELAQRRPVGNAPTRPPTAGDKPRAQAILPPPSAEHVQAARFCHVLGRLLSGQGAMVFDDGPLAHLAAPGWPGDATDRLNGLIPISSPGHSVPAAMGAKLARHDAPVIALVSDASLRNAGLELVTAAEHELGLVVLVITQAGTSLCADAEDGLAPTSLELEAVAQATGSTFLRMSSDARVEPLLTQALSLADKGVVVLVEVSIDPFPASVGHRSVSQDLGTAEPRSVMRLASRRPRQA